MQCCTDLLGISISKDISTVCDFFFTSGYVTFILLQVIVKNFLQFKYAEVPPTFFHWFSLWNYFLHVSSANLKFCLEFDLLRREACLCRRWATRKSQVVWAYLSVFTFSIIATCKQHSCTFTFLPSYWFRKSHAVKDS